MPRSAVTVSHSERISQYGGPANKARKRRVVAAAAGFVIGVGLLLAGVVINVIPIAVAGFAVMLTGSLWAVDSYRRMTGRAPAQGLRPGKKRRAAKCRRTGKQTGSGLMGRLEERWRHRQQGGR